MTSEHDEQHCQLTPVPGGGVTTALGFMAAGIHAGFRKNPQRKDMALVVATQPCSCAGMFTQNVFCAAPVQLCRENLDEGGVGCSYGTVKAMVINSGTANAATGEPGLMAAREATGIVADALGCPSQEVLMASTGVIGEFLPMGPFVSGVPEAVSLLSREGGTDAACAIMTTDTCSKEYAVQFSGARWGKESVTYHVGGMTKGSGMIMPNMATMIAVITTDAPLTSADLHTALQQAVAKSFNKVTVDSDTSTNDTCILMASGEADPDSREFVPGTEAFSAFQCALDEVCTQLARSMAKDGEGSSRLITITVKGAMTEDDADKAARAIANSPLVKTAVYGHDANWGRIAAAIGKSGAQFKQEDASIDILGIPVCRKGLAIKFDEEEALRRFESPEITIEVDLGAGSAETTVWTCDLTHDYITINGDYRT